MKIFLVQLICRIMVISGISVTKLCGQSIKPDTLKPLASALKNDEDYATLSEARVVKEANVIFPDILEDHKHQSIEYVEKFSDKKRDYLLRIYEKSKKFFPKIVNVLKQYQLPEELKVLMALESEFSANVISKAGAVGYWQLMEVAAKEYGLQIVPLRKTTAVKATKTDDRKNLTKSTVAAAKYLRDRKQNLNNDLLLMVASYNCGMGTIRNAIRKCHKEDANFWDLKSFLPKETRNYVMNFIALNVIFNNYENFANRQLLFSPKLIYQLPYEIPFYNNSIPVKPVDVD